MGMGEEILIAVGLSVNTCAIAVDKGLTFHTVRLRQILWLALWFGVLQAVMMLGGLWLGLLLSAYRLTCGNQVSFFLLSFVGGRILWETFSKSASIANPTSPSPSSLASAIGINAFLVGLALSLLAGTSVFSTVVWIVVLTFLLSMLGMGLGGLLGAKYRAAYQVAGGMIVVGVGIRLLLAYFDTL